MCLVVSMTNVILTTIVRLHFITLRMVKKCNIKLSFMALLMLTLIATSFPQQGQPQSALKNKHVSQCSVTKFLQNMFLNDLSLIF